MPDPHDTHVPDERSPVEGRIQRSFEDEDMSGRPLSRRARQTKRTVEAYLKAGVIPRYMRRLSEIDRGIARERRRLEQAHRALSAQCGEDRELFARRWRACAREWRFELLNELIREHNEWYPIEAGLAMDPRTRNYVRIRGRSYQRPQLGPEWVLEQFPADPLARAQAPPERAPDGERVAQQRRQAAGG